MKKKKVWRYYCEYCKKSGGHPYWIERHEKGCTMNPDRDCRMCSLIGEDQKPIKELVSIIGNHASKSEEYLGGMPFISINIRDEAGLLKKLREATGDCPACILAAIRQSETPLQFNFKNERERFFQDYNDKYGYY